MHILFVIATSSDSIGGLESQTLLQAKYLNQIEGYKVSLICDYNIAPYADENIDVYPMKMARSRRNPILLAQLRALIFKISPKIVHAHGHKATTLVGSIRPFLGKQCKLIATSHGIKKNNKSLGRMDGIIVISQAMQDHLSQYNPKLIHNGIEPFALEKNCSNLLSIPNLQSNRPSIVAVGRLVKVKRYDLLIKACANLSANLIIVGDGPERGTLESIAEENTFLIGHRKDANLIIQSADILVISSEREGFGLTLIEALMGQTPVISSNVGICPEILPKGHIVDPLTCDSLTEVIEDNLFNLDETRKEFTPIFKLARTQFTIEENIQKTLSYYQEQLSKGNHSKDTQSKVTHESHK